MPESEEGVGCLGGGCSVLLALGGIVWLVYACSQPKIEDAVNLEDKGEYSKAYQAYAKVLVDKSKKFAMPSPKDDINDWIKSISQDYIQFIVNQPDGSDCRTAYSKLFGNLRDQITYLELTYHEQDRAYDESTFLMDFKGSLYSDQKSMSDDELKNAKLAFANHLSIVSIHNVGFAPLEGVLYSPDLDRGETLHLGKWDSKATPVKPGPLVLVSRLAVESTDETNQGYLKAVNDQGRYAAYFFVAPQLSTLISLTVEVNSQE